MLYLASFEGLAKISFLSYVAFCRPTLTCDWPLTSQLIFLLIFFSHFDRQKAKLAYRRSMVQKNHQLYPIANLCCCASHVEKTIFTMRTICPKLIATPSLLSVANELVHPRCFATSQQCLTNLFAIQHLFAFVLAISHQCLTNLFAMQHFPFCLCPCDIPRVSFPWQDYLQFKIFFSSFLESRMLDIPQASFTKLISLSFFWYLNSLSAV